MVESKAKAADKTDEPAAEEQSNVETMKAAPERVETYVPEEGPSPEDPAVVPAESLASAGSTADVPNPGPDVIVSAPGQSREDAKAERDNSAPEAGAVDAEGSHAGTVLRGKFNPANVSD